MEERESEPAPRRRLTLADLALIVAASAVATVLGRSWNEFAKVPIADMMYVGWKRGFVWANACLVATIMLLLVARFLPPRPGFRDAIRRAGTFPLIIIIGEWVFFSAQVGLQVLLKPTIASIPNYFFVSCMSVISYSGHTLCLIWLILFFAGAWRSSPDWVDRSGRLLGLFMIVYWLVSVIAQ